MATKLNWLRSVWNSAQTQILLWVTVLMLGAGVGSTLTARQFLRLQLEQRVNNALAQEVAEIEQLIDGRNPLTGELFSGDIKAIFDVFLARNIPENSEVFITLINGSLYSKSSLDWPIQEELLGQQLNQWQSLIQLQQGRLELAGEIWVYLAYPMPIQKNDRGVFIVMQSLSHQQRQLDRVIWLEAQVLSISMLVVLILAWVATGRVLAPLQDLTQTARTMTATEDHLQQRIPVRGTVEIAELTETFNAMLARLQTSFISQRNFLNDASHELQTPITIIKGHLDLLSQSSEDFPELVDTITLMQDELQRMSRLVKDLLLLAMAERADFLALNIVPIDNFLQAIYTKVGVMAPRQWVLAQTPAVRIVADRDRLTQAMMNLIQNAIEHTDSGDTIELGAKLVNQHIYLWVRDTGHGISPIDQLHIFQRFARGTEAQKRRDGSGLGLAIVQAIAEAHGGQLSLTDTSPQGSCFTVVLPLEPPQERRDNG